MTDRLRDVDHTHPHTDASFGRTQVFDRGTTVVADGGEAAANDPAAGQLVPNGGEDRDADDETLADVDHTPADEAVDGAQDTFDRGREGSADRDDE